MAKQATLQFSRDAFRDVFTPQVTEHPNQGQTMDVLIGRAVVMPERLARVIPATPDQAKER